MRIVLGAITLFCLAVSMPGAAADKDSPFLISKKEFKKQYQTIALSPVDADALLQMPEAVGAMIEEEVTKHLQKRGYEVIPTSVLAGIRETMEGQVGGFEEPQTGRVDQAKVKAVRSHAFRELWFRHELDAIATIRVSTTKVTVENDNAAWDGTKQKIERDGKRINYTGQIIVSSVSFAVYDHTDRLKYINHGGLESLMWRNNDQLVPLPSERFFTDEKRIRKAAQIAMKPI